MTLRLSPQLFTVHCSLFTILGYLWPEARHQPFAQFALQEFHQTAGKEMAQLDRLEQVEHALAMRRDLEGIVEIGAGFCRDAEDAQGRNLVEIGNHLGGMQKMLIGNIDADRNQELDIALAVIGMVVQAQLQGQRGVIVEVDHQCLLLFGDFESRAFEEGAKIVQTVVHYASFHSLINKISKLSQPLDSASQPHCYYLIQIHAPCKLIYVKITIKEV